MEQQPHNSSTSGPPGVDPVNIAHPEAQSLSTLSIDWVVFLRDTPQMDYRPISSCGSEGEVLVEEVAEICRDFYSISEPFPKDERGYFFWASQKKKNYWALMVVRQVSGDEAAGLRPTLEFVALLLTDAQYSEFGRNTVTLIDANLFAAAREASRTAPPFAPISIISRPTIAHSEPPSEAVRQMFDTGGELVWSPETQGNLLGYLANDKVARSFATWWPATRPVPTGLFHVVLRSPTPEQLLQGAHPAGDFGGINQQQQAITGPRLIPSGPMWNTAGNQPKKVKIDRPLSEAPAARTSPFLVGGILALILLCCTLWPYINLSLDKPHPAPAPDKEKRPTKTAAELQSRQAEVNANLEKNQADLSGLQQRRDALRLLLDPSQKGLPWRKAFDAWSTAHEKLVQAQSALDQLLAQMKSADKQTPQRIRLEQEIQHLQAPRNIPRTDTPEDDPREMLLKHIRDDKVKLKTAQDNLKSAKEALLDLNSQATYMLDHPDEMPDWKLKVSAQEKKCVLYQGQCDALQDSIISDQDKLVNLQQASKTQETRKTPQIPDSVSQRLAELEKQQDRLYPSPPSPEALETAENEVRKRSDNYEVMKRNLDSLDPQVTNNILELHKIEAEIEKLQTIQKALQQDLVQINNLLKLAQ